MKTLVIPMAGLGSRFSKAGFDKHKPLIEVGGKTLIRHSIDSLGLGDDWKVVLICRKQEGSYKEAVEAEVPEATFVWIDELTSGAAETCLYAQDHIDPDDELIITNCDQFLDWDVDSFLKQSVDSLFNGSVLTYDSTDPKNSFCRSVDGKIVEIVEKKAISNEALVGLHWWRYGQDFLEPAARMVENFTGDRETYISEVYSDMVRDGLVKAIPIDGKYWSIGTPEDFYVFKGYLAEYRSAKPQTFFIDLDGTVLMHGHRYSNLHKGQEACPGVVETLDQLDSQGHTIILVSARKESSRSFTEENLARLGIPYDQLILGVSQGRRVVVNDVITKTSAPRAAGVNVLTDQGWKAEDVL